MELGSVPAPVMKFSCAGAVEPESIARAEHEKRICRAHALTLGNGHKDSTRGGSDEIDLTDGEVVDVRGRNSGQTGGGIDGVCGQGDLREDLRWLHLQD